MIGKIYTAQEFKQKFKDTVFIKLTNVDKNHNGFQYQTGLNKDPIPFNSHNSGQSGGLYFCALDKLVDWLDYSDKPLPYIRVVSFPDNAMIYEEQHTFKADQLILSEKSKIKELDIWKDSKYCLRIVKQKGDFIKYITNQTNEICLEAVRSSGTALQYILNQTDEICLEAIKSDPLSLIYVLNQTEFICLEAIKLNLDAFQYVLNQTELICLSAIRHMNQIIGNKTNPICHKTFDWSYSVFNYIKNQTDLICLEAVKQHGFALKFVKNQTDLICFEAVKQNGEAFAFVNERNKPICLQSIK